MASQQLRARLFQIADAESKVAGALSGGRRGRPRKVGRPRGSALQDPHDFYTGLLEGGNDDYNSLLQGGNDDYNSLLQGGRKRKVGRPRLSAKKLGALHYSMGVGVARGGRCASMKRRDSKGRFVKSGCALSGGKRSLKRSARQLGLNMSGRVSSIGSGVGGNVRAQLKARLEKIAKHSKMSYTGGRRSSKRKSSKYNNGVLRTSMHGGRRLSRYNNGVLRTARRGKGLNQYSLFVKANYHSIKNNLLQNNPGIDLQTANRMTFQTLAEIWRVDGNKGSRVPSEYLDEYDVIRASEKGKRKVNGPRQRLNKLKAEMAKIEVKTDHLEKLEEMGKITVKQEEQYDKLIETFNKKQAKAYQLEQKLEASKPKRLASLAKARSARKSSKKAKGLSGGRKSSRRAVSFY